MQGTAAVSAANGVNFYDLSLEDLLKIEVITAEKKTQKVADIPASVVIVTREDISQRGYRNLTDILKNVPGFYVIETDTYYGSPVGVRGFFTDTARNVKFLINGDDVVDDWNNSYRSIGRDVPVSAIERIELVRGPMSVIYGSGAFLGVINIITKSVEENTAYAETKISYGSRNTKRASARLVGNTIVGQNNTPVSVTVNFANEISEGREYRYGDLTSDNRIFESLAPGVDNVADLTTRGILDYDRTYLDATVNISKLTFNVMHTAAKNGEAFSFVTYLPGAHEQLAKTVVSITFSDEISDSFNYSIKAGISRLVSTWNTHHIEPGIELEEIMNTSAKFLDMDGFYDITNDSSLTFGFAYRQVDWFRYDWIAEQVGFHETIKLAPGDKKETYAIYSNYSHNLHENMKLIMGLRAEGESKYTVNKGRNVNLDFFEGSFGFDEDTFGPSSIEINGNQDTDLDVIPRLGLIYQLEDHAFKLLYSESNYQPGLFQYSEGNGAQLKSEKMKTVELIALGSFMADTQYSVSLFSNQVDNLAVRETSSDANIESVFISRTTNIGAVDTIGFELSYGAKLLEYLKIDISTTLQKSDNSRSGFRDIDLEYSPKVLAYLNLNYVVFDGLDVNLSSRYISAMKTLWSGTADEGGRIGKEQPGYSVWGVAARWQQNIEENELTISPTVDNLFNKSYRLPTTSFINWADQGLPGDERTLQLSANVRF